MAVGRMMRLGMVAALLLPSAAPEAGFARTAAVPRREGLCRRAPSPVILPPEGQPGSHFQPRDRDGGPTPEVTPPPVMMGVAPPPMITPTAPPAPPPPPPPPPPPVAAMDAAAPSGDIIVTTGRRLPSAGRSRASAAESAPGSAFAPRRPGQAAPQPGLLTAGDHDDLLNPELYARYADRFLGAETLAGVPRVDTGRVLTVAVRDAAGRPVPFAAVTLTCADGNRLSLATVADGTAVFFPALDRLGARVSIAVAAAGGAAAGARSVSLAGAAGAQRQTITVAGGAAPVRRFDLALMADTTGSMGDELEYLKSELRAILDDLKRGHPQLDIRLALVFYRDRGDEYVTRTFPFTASLATTQANLAAQVATGGGDEPEAVEQAIARTVALDWRPDAIKSILFVADAPPHADDIASTWRSAEVARAKRIQIVPVGASGVNPAAEYMMRAMAAVTQSRYLFLTDDSGIGNAHAPPQVDCYLVTRLDALVRRVLDSQISGRRIEPREGEVIRAVGSYDGGRCVGRGNGRR